MRVLSACGPRWRPSRLLYLVLFNYYNQLSISTINHHQPVPLVSFFLSCVHISKRLYHHVHKSNTKKKDKHREILILTETKGRALMWTPQTQLKQQWLSQYLSDSTLYEPYEEDRGIIKEKTVIVRREWRGGGVKHHGSVEVADSSRARENNGAESTSLRPFIPL